MGEIGCRRPRLIKQQWLAKLHCFAPPSRTGRPLGLFFYMRKGAVGPAPKARVRSLAAEGGQTEELKTCLQQPWLAKLYCLALPSPTGNASCKLRARSSLESKMTVGTISHSLWYIVTEMWEKSSRFSVKVSKKVTK